MAVLGEKPWCARRYSFMFPSLGMLTGCTTGVATIVGWMGWTCATWGWGTTGLLLDNAVHATSATADSEAAADRA